MRFLSFVFLMSFINFSFAAPRQKGNVKKSEKKVINLDQIILSSSMRTRVVDSENLKSRVFGYVFGIKIKDKINSDLELFFDGMMSLETGSNNEVANNSEFSPVDTVDLNEGGILYHPIKFINLRVGALNQKIFHSPLFLTSVSFAGIEEKFQFRNLYIRAQQAIPSNNQLSKRIGTVDQGTPMLSTVTLGLTWDHDFFFIGELTGFSFKDLSSGTADASSSFGNSTKNIGDASEFSYEFEGQNLFLKTGFKFLNQEIGLQGHYLYNDKAPEKRNKSNLIKLYYRISRVSFGLENFRSESDASPAFYNSKWYGHSNRVGQGFFIDYEKKDFSFSLAYRKAQEIEDYAVQYDQEYLTFYLSKDYTF